MHFGSFFISGGIAFFITTILSYYTSDVGRSRALRFFITISGIVKKHIHTPCYDQLDSNDVRSHRL